MKRKKYEALALALVGDEEGAIPEGTRRLLAEAFINGEKIGLNPQQVLHYFIVLNCHDFVEFFGLLELYEELKGIE